MFVVLDGAKRMLANFEDLARSSHPFTVNGRAGEIADGKRSIELSCELHGLKRKVVWGLPCALGNKEEPDFNHPYFMASSSMKPSEDREPFIKTVAGSMVHFSEVRAGDRLSAYPNFYDFEFLDSNSRRYDLRLSNGARKSNVADFYSKPVLLDEFAANVVGLWDKLSKGQLSARITDTKLRNLQSLWLTKYREWNVDLAATSSETHKQWTALVEASIRKEFGNIGTRCMMWLREMLLNGIFFDSLELHLGVLKKKIGQDENIAD
jgi:hypothetical protein